MIKRMIIFMFLALVLVSCGQATPSAAPIETEAPQVETITPTPFVPATNTPEPSATPTPKPTATKVPPTATSTPAAYGPENFPENVNPLTGKIVSDPSVLDRRVMSVKVNIYPRTIYRPPWGLNAADVVWEYYHNDGASRLHAIFYGEDPELVGPIRSGRLLDDMIVRIYDSIFVYAGADSNINSRFLNSDYFSRLIVGGFDNPACPPTDGMPLCTFEPNGRHNLIGGGENLREYIDTKKIDNNKQVLTGQSFAELTPDGGEDGTEAVVRYSFDMFSKWAYDSETGTYLAFRDKEAAQGDTENFDPLVDRNDEKQVSVENVIVLVVPDEYAQRPPAEIVEIYLLGTGDAYAFRDGEVFQVKWNHATKDSMMYLTYADGSPYPLKPGQSWIYVVNPESRISGEEGAWRFVYNIRP